MLGNACNIIGTHCTTGTTTSWRWGVISQIYAKPLLVFGCGNTLLGDDGFGSAVIAQLLAGPPLPAACAVLDVGTASRELLFDLLLAPVKPRLLLVIDAADPSDLAPGQLRELPLDDIAAPKANDFSLHQFPSLNLLAELADLGGVTVRVLAVKAGIIPETVRPGLSPAVAAAVPQAAAWARQALLQAAAELETRAARA